MFVTNVLLKKSKYVMVLLQSTGSKHTIVSIRERINPKKEIIYRDPYVDLDCVYKEVKKIRSLKYNINVKKDNNEHTYGIIKAELENK